MAQPAKRICTKCLQSLPIEDFYSKGTRSDSRCKTCVKSVKKSKYVAKEQILRLDSLLKIFSLISEIEISAISRQIQRLDEEIKRCQQLPKAQ